MLLADETTITIFGDNDRDFFRSVQRTRSYFGGMAQVCGTADCRHTYGFITTFYHNPPPVCIEDYMPYLKMHCQDLRDIMDNGYNIRIPSPSISELQDSHHLYFYENEQVVFHKLGTGIANLSQEFLVGIQAVLDQLAPHPHPFAELPSRKEENARKPHAPFNDDEDFSAFLSTHTQFIPSSIDHSLTVELQGTLEEYLIPILANQDVFYGRRTGMRYEMLFGDICTFPGLHLTHSNLPPLMATQFPPLLARVGQLLYTQVNPKPNEFDFNSCLVNYYPDGEWYCGLHKDDEQDHDGNVLLLHLGATRKFTMLSSRRNPEYRREIEMSNGDGLFCDPTWARSIIHGKLADRTCSDPHITVTFRHIYHTLLKS
jgi:hypothetical protein